MLLLYLGIDSWLSLFCVRRQTMCQLFDSLSVVPASSLPNCSGFGGDYSDRRLRNCWSTAEVSSGTHSMNCVGHPSCQACIFSCLGMGFLSDTVQAQRLTRDRRCHVICRILLRCGGLRPWLMLLCSGNVRFWFSPYDLDESGRAWIFVSREE